MCGQMHHICTRARACLHTHTAGTRKHTHSHRCTHHVTCTRTTAYAHNGTTSTHKWNTYVCVTTHDTNASCTYTSTLLTMQSMRAGRQVRVHTPACAPSQALAASPAGPPVIAPSPGVWQIALAGRRRPPLINPSFSRAPSAGARNCGPAGPSPAQARNQKADFRAGHLFAGLRLFPPLCFISARR